MESFQELELPEFLRQSLQQMNFVKPMPVQAQAIPVALEGKDVIASAQTGTGKTAAFGLPLLTYLEKNKDKTALVLTPTRELAVQVLDVLRKLTGTHNLGGSVLLIGGANMSAQFSALTRKPRLIIGTPGRVIDHLNRGSLVLGATGFLVLDEADRMLDMGFAPQLEEIRKRLTGPRQTLLFSATFPPDIQAMGSKYLKEPVRIAVGSATQPVTKIAQKVLYTTEAKKPEELSEELKERRGSVLIFARTQHRVDRIMNRLKESGVKATRIHGGRTQSQRKQAIDQFREGKFDVLVATDIAARGLDIHHIAHVINYDLPRNPEDYIHRVGRTARAGAEGEALCFLTPEDSDLWRRILRLIGANAQSIPVKPSRFGFTAPRPDQPAVGSAKTGAAPRHNQQAPRPNNQHALRPHNHNQGRPGQGQPQQGRPSHHRDEHRGQRDFQHKNRHP
ncbi:MAG TPA: DEAD/DEAH box helicase, partial [bacterium]|nr:DEAD/DEAH box helicase [bacterium]